MERYTLHYRKTPRPFQLGFAGRWPYFGLFRSVLFKPNVSPSTLHDPHSK